MQEDGKHSQAPRTPPLAHLLQISTTLTNPEPPFNVEPHTNPEWLFNQEPVLHQ